MISFKNFCNESESNIRVKDTEEFKPKSKTELKSIIDKLIKERGLEADLNNIDVSNVKDMANMFAGSKFNGDISKWDVSKVVNMSDTFYNSPLEKNPPEWYTEYMFYNSPVE
jgi:hypothetical protein